MKATTAGAAIAERVALLEQTALGRIFATEDLRGLSEYLQLEKVHEGHTIFQEGVKGDSLFIVAVGSVEIVKRDSAMKAKRIAVVREGRMFGEMSLIDGAPRSASAIAVGDTTLLTLSKSSFDRLMAKRAKLATLLLLHVGWLMSQRLRATSGQLTEYLQAD